MPEAATAVATPIKKTGHPILRWTFITLGVIFLICIMVFTGFWIHTSHQMAAVKSIYAQIEGSAHLEDESIAELRKADAATWSEAKELGFATAQQVEIDQFNASTKKMGEYRSHLHSLNVTNCPEEFREAFAKYEASFDVFAADAAKNPLLTTSVHNGDEYTQFALSSAETIRKMTADFEHSIELNKAMNAVANDWGMNFPARALPSE